MSQRLSENMDLKSKIKNLPKKDKEKILDIILFGSTVRGKEKPKDVDILLLFKEKEDMTTAYQVKKELEKTKKEVNIITKTYQTIGSKTFPAREAILAEGYSLFNEQGMAQKFGFKNYTLFKYKLKGLNQSERMRFHYSLYGRHREGGMLKTLKLTKFSDTILLSPIEKTEETREYLAHWKIIYTEMPILIPERINI